MFEGMLQLRCDVGFRSSIRGPSGSVRKDGDSANLSPTLTRLVS